MAQLIPVEKIEDNMVLVEPILNNFGQTLLPSGTVLSKKHARLLKTWNINFVSIKSSDDDISSEIAPEILEKAKEILKTRMKWEPKLNYELDLFQIGIYHLAKELQNSKKGY